MKIAVYGAGAIGGVVGAGIAAANRDVVLVDAVEEHVDAMNRRGLCLRSARSDRLIPVRAVTHRI